jgi:hypothetical protein
MAKIANICADKIQRNKLSWPHADEGAETTTYVKSDVYPHESKVPPMMAIENIRIRLQELVCGPVWAESTTIRGVRIRDIAAEIVDELAEVLLAGLTQGRLNCYIFDWCAGNLSAPDR